jgi:DNA primase
MAQVINEILERLDPMDFLDREGIEYRETIGSNGRQLNVRTCPKCGGDKWKVFLNAETGLGNCFSGSCNAKFNKYLFMQAQLGISGRQLFEYIENLGREIGWRPPRKSQKVEIARPDLVIPASYPIPIDGKNLAYLRNRGITIDVAQYFALRFCLKGWFKYKWEDGSEHFMNFSNRVIIPVFDLNGKLVSFQGRDITGEAEKKYLFPPGFAATGEHLYNGHNVINTESVVVGEGVFDVMACKIALDQDQHLRDVVPVGTFGKHLSQKQLDNFLILKDRGVKNVTMMWDSEQQAIDDALVAAQQLKGVGFNVRVAILPNGKDPNEVAPAVVRQAYYAAMPYSMTNAVKIRLAARAE